MLDISRFEDSFKELEILKAEIEKYPKKQLYEQKLVQDTDEIQIRYVKDNDLIKMEVFANVGCQDDERDNSR